MRGFLDMETCQSVLTELRQSSGDPALTYGRGDSPLVDQRTRRVSRVVPSLATIDLIHSRLMKIKAQLEHHFTVRLGDCEEPQFLCYRVGDFFVAHQDGNTGLVQLATDQSRRISISIFINNQGEAAMRDTFSGGSLVFSDWRQDLRLECKGEAGTLIAFRSETTHEVTPVTRGERYSIVSWFAGGADLPIVAL